MVLLAVSDATINEDESDERRRDCEGQPLSSPKSIQDNDESSVNSVDEALCEMLGITSLEVVQEAALTMREEEEEESLPNNNIDHTFTPISLPPNCSRYGDDAAAAAVWVDHLCTPAECRALIDLAVAHGPRYISEATHHAPDGSTWAVPLQNPNPHKLAVFQHDATLQLLEQRIMTLLVKGRWLAQFQHRFGRVLGLNPRLRVLRYDAADEDRFEPHFDATTVIDGKTSRITVLLYLNSGDGQDFGGGETLFLSNTSTTAAVNYANNNNKYDGSTTTAIAPMTGRVVMFEHDLYHSSAPLEWGTKFVLRTDILLDDDKMHEEKPINENNQHNTANDDDKSQKNHTTMSVSTTTTILHDDTNDRPLRLVRQLCESFATDWPAADLQAFETILNDMGLLHASIDAFWVPGRALLEQMLREEGGAPAHIHAFLARAQEEQAKKGRQNDALFSSAP